jgi:hypothetical protein
MIKVIDVTIKGDTPYGDLGVSIGATFPEIIFEAILVV